MGIKSQDRLMFALDAPHKRMFGAELYPDVPSKVAALAFLIVKSHPFVSANASTALLAMHRFLELNGYTLRNTVGSGELIRLVRALNYSDMGREDLEDWLREHATVTE
jgi:death-on-curing protein